LGGLPVADAHKAVAGAQVADPVAVQGSGQHLVTVGPDLDLKGEPGLEADVAEAELVVDHIQVELTALRRRRTTSRRWVARLPLTSNDPHGSIAANAQINPEVMPSRSAIWRASSSLE
jgi:hypothetical protein